MNNHRGDTQTRALPSIDRDLLARATGGALDDIGYPACTLENPTGASPQQFAERYHGGDRTGVKQYSDWYDRNFGQEGIVDTFNGFDTSDGPRPTRPQPRPGRPARSIRLP